jgi:hypothetical protein
MRLEKDSPLFFGPKTKENCDAKPRKKDFLLLFFSLRRLLFFLFVGFAREEKRKLGCSKRSVVAHFLVTFVSLSLLACERRLETTPNDVPLRREEDGGGEGPLAAQQGGRRPHEARPQGENASDQGPFALPASLFCCGTSCFCRSCLTRLFVLPKAAAAGRRRVREEHVRKADEVRLPFHPAAPRLSSPPTSHNNHERLLYAERYHDEELEEFSRTLHQNTLMSMKTLVLAARHFGYEVAPDMEKTAGHFFQLNPRTNGELTATWIRRIKMLWKDRAIQKTYARRNEVCVLGCWLLGELWLA